MPGDADVIIVGGGIVGVSTSYFLGKIGVKNILVEQDALGSHASGFAYGGLSGLWDADNQNAAAASVASEGFQLHKQLALELPEATDSDKLYRKRPILSLALTEQEAATGRNRVLRQNCFEGVSIQWVDADEARIIEPRISPEVYGAAYVEGTLDVDSYRLVESMAQAAEVMGATIRYGRVTGLKRNGNRVGGVIINGQIIHCRCVVLAMGPWSNQVSDWVGVNVPVTPLKGQILRLRTTGLPYHCSVNWNGNYAVTKPDGLVWAGTTEERAGFSETTTVEARDRIMETLTKMIPFLEDSELLLQTACLRPLSSDKLPVLGSIDDLEGVYLATGGGRQGILLGPAMGYVAANLVTNGISPIPIDGLDVGRFYRP